jgi:hypothetical protein
MALGLWASVALVLMSGGGVEAYKNYTVGDSLGWYDNIMKSQCRLCQVGCRQEFQPGRLFK